MSSECMVCKKYFASHTAMIMHAENVHGRGGVYNAAWEQSRGQAGESPTGRAGDVRHYIDSSFYNWNSELWECPHCSRGFVSSDSLLRHLQSETHVRNEHCREFSTLTSLSPLTNTARSQHEINRPIHTTTIPSAQRGRPVQVRVEATLYFDGGATPNPGWGACGWFLFDNIRCKEITRGGRPLGYNNTNNMAEYSGLINGLIESHRLGIRRLHVKGDSELVIRQMTGEYRVSSTLLAPYHRSAMSWVQAFQSVTFEHISRRDNYIADCIAACYIGQRRGEYG